MQLQGKQNLGTACPKGKSEFKFFSNPAFKNQLQDINNQTVRLNIGCFVVFLSNLTNYNRANPSIDSTLK